MKPLLLICLSQFCIALGVNLVNPIWPLYASSFNISYVMVGLVLSSFGLIRIFFEIPAGMFADRVGKKPVILLGYGLSALSHLIAGLAQTVVELVVSQMVLGVGTALLLNASLTYVGELTNVEGRARYIAVFQSTFFLAGVIGPALGGMIAEILSMRTIFLLSCGISVMGVILVLLVKVHLHMSSSDRETQGGGNILAIIKDTQIVVLGTACFVLFFLFKGIRGTLIPLWGAEIAFLTSFQIGLIISLNSIVTTIMLLFITHRLEKRMSRFRLLVVSLLVCSLSVFLLSFATDFVTLAILMVPIGIGLGVLQPTPFSIVIDYAKPERVGLTMGVLRTIGDLGVILGPMIVGWLMDLDQAQLVFYSVAGMIGLFALVTHTTLKKTRESQNHRL